jgi:Holliday junction resolvase RusA-like endonuclease
VIELRFLGEPAPQGSKVLTRFGAMREASKKIEPWRAVVQYQSEQQYKGPVIEGPVSIDVTFVFTRAKSHWSTAKGKTDQLLPSAPLHYTKTPDLDKAIRGLLDPLTTRCGGCVLKDDSSVVEIVARKRYAKRCESAGALVRIEHICANA